MSGALPVAKLAVNVIASVGVSKVVNDFVRNNTTTETTADAVKVAVGSLVIGSIVADAASKHVNERMNNVVAWFSNRKNTEVPAE